MTLLETNKKIKEEGFTLVELLVVVSLVGILAGITISIINPVKQRKVAEDGIKQSNLQKYALGIEAYANANGSYPVSINLIDVDGDGVVQEPEDPEVRNFISKVPKDMPTVGTYYVYAFYDGRFAIAVEKSDSIYSECFRYRSAWGKIKTCPPGACGVENSLDDGACY